MIINNLHTTLAAQNVAALGQLTDEEREAMQHDCTDCGEDATTNLFGIWLCDKCKPEPIEMTMADWFDDDWFRHQDLHQTYDDMVRAGW